MDDRITHGPHIFLIPEQIDFREVVESLERCWHWRAFERKAKIMIMNRRLDQPRIIDPGAWVKLTWPAATFANPNLGSFHETKIIQWWMKENGKLFSL